MTKTHRLAHNDQPGADDAEAWLEGALARALRASSAQLAVDDFAYWARVSPERFLALLARLTPPPAPPAPEYAYVSDHADGRPLGPELTAEEWQNEAREYAKKDGTYDGTW